LDDTCQPRGLSDPPQSVPRGKRGVGGRKEGTRDGGREGERERQAGREGGLGREGGREGEREGRREVERDGGRGGGRSDLGVERHLISLRGSKLSHLLLFFPLQILLIPTSQKTLRRKGRKDRLNGKPYGEEEGERDQKVKEKGTEKRKRNEKREENDTVQYRALAL